MYRKTSHTSRTRDSRKSATWILVAGSAHILSVQLHGELFAGHQYPDTPMQGAPTGQITFDSDRTPDLAAARELLPRHDDLWDAVRKDYWAAVSVFGPAARQRHYRPWESR